MEKGGIYVYLTQVFMQEALAVEMDGSLIHGLNSLIPLTATSVLSQLQLQEEPKGTNHHWRIERDLINSAFDVEDTDLLDESSLFPELSSGSGDCLLS